MTTLVMETCTEDFVHHEEAEEEYCSYVEEEVEFQQHEEKYISNEESYTFPGPLLRADLQKDELMKFIQQKCQECLLHLDDPQQQKSYFFWTIMERFFKKDGRVMMAEIATVLFRGHSLLRRKLQRVDNQETWCLRLARLLCSKTPDNQHRKDIINMGDRFASRGWLFPAHICYVVAQVKLGSRFTLIGCNSSLPENQSEMRDTMERTEVYEYLLSLKSGFGQIKFQSYKCIHAYELAGAGLHDLALDYCEVIATTVLRFTDHIHIPVLEMLISLGEELLQRNKAEEPEWLPKIRQLLEDEAEHSSSSSSNDSNCSSSASDEPVKFDPSVHSELNSRYTVGELLGKGGFGSVYAGVRKADKQPVAIKVMTKHQSDIFIRIPGEKIKLPLEVALMEIMSKPPCEYIVQLLEWFETSDVYILVMERPVPCMDLYQFCKLNKRRLSESVAREVMRQVVKAAHECYLRGVLHRDIKPLNILIDPEKLKVKLIDFGCGDLMKYEPFREYAGTDGYYPPEWILKGKYLSVPATVWSLGILLYELIHGDLPFQDDDELVEGRICFDSNVSEECCDLIRLCLEPDPSSRPKISKILAHKWFKMESQDLVQKRPDVVQERQNSVQGPVNASRSCSCDGDPDVWSWCH